jgi:two-component system, OmpR family, alkaline phosphatase synthesis response regulator PhoP
MTEGHVQRILIVEDNPDLAFGLRNNLEIEGYDVSVAEDGIAGLGRARMERPDLVILDLGLPGMDGYRVLRIMRDEGLAMPVLILSAEGEEANKVRGFRLGADDYVTKPFSLLELLARVEALLRRAVRGPAGNRVVYSFGDVVVEPDAKRVTQRGEPVVLAPREFALLLALVRRQGAVVTRGELMREVWGHRGLVLSRTVDTHIAELRRKLEPDPANPVYILTVRKTGYRVHS